MDDYIYDPQDSWEYGTGRTEPPKSRGGIVAVLLILVIFLTGIVTVLSILNIRLVKQLGLPQNNRELAISFTNEETQPQETQARTPEPAQDDFNMDLQSTPALQSELPQGALSRQQIYQQNIPSVVSISCALPGGRSSGTGVVLTRDGLLVTNAHVV